MLNTGFHACNFFRSPCYPQALFGLMNGAKNPSARERRARQEIDQFGVARLEITLAQERSSFLSPVEDRGNNFLPNRWIGIICSRPAQPFLHGWIGVEILTSDGR